MKHQRFGSEAMPHEVEGQDALPDLTDPLTAESEFDSLASLFLEDDAPPPRPKASPSPQPIRSAPAASSRTGPRIEALVMGHLPTMASAWASQYARMLAGGDETIALIRDAAEERSVECFGRNAPSAARSEVEAVSSIARASAVVLRVDETDEPDLIDASAKHQVTMLTAGDDAAIVAAYRTLKRLFGAHTARERRVAVAVMGAPDDVARRAFQRMSRAASSFLGLELTFIGAAQRITPEPARVIWRGPRIRADYKTLLHTIESAKPSPMRSVAIPPTPQPRPAPRAAIREPEPSHDWLDLLPETADAPDFAAERSPRGRELLRGVYSAEIRCPVAHDVEIGVDAGGRVHLIARDEADQPAACLLAASEWARENFELLALAIAARGLGSPRDAHAPAMHVATRSPARAREMLRCGLMVHVLADVQVDGRTATACIGLG